ncbi:uncharacterized protein LOC6037536 isoform X2 [Culex quinquefasciatus]|uniref:uncharacterized protein LOC6037536 isoform X2 n=1 Tax=Culex quinquefasciatus TaxID=7176 RepID=UPI0018E3B9B2|nr:uncharacterized protein LOC6037536 isoform X2 [Culex quinquefasciatus]
MWLWVLVAASFGGCAVLGNVAPHRGESLLMPDERTSLDDCHVRFYKFYQSGQGGIGGRPARLNEFAHMGAIGWVQPDGEVAWKCGGSLIWDNFVLTAAHCAVDERNFRPDVVRFGDLNIFSAEGDETAQQVKIAEVIRHPEHRFSANYHDVALLRLERNVTINKAVVPACLWPHQEVRFKRMHAVGWGQVGFGEKQTPELLKMELSPVPSSDCEKVFNNETIRKLRSGLQEQHICASDKVADTCQGDSGGPLQVKLMHNIRETPFIVGVTSFGLPCSPDSPGVYTRVAPYLDWILVTMKESGAPVDEQTFNTTTCAHRYVKLRDYYDAIVTKRNGSRSEIDAFQQHLITRQGLPPFVAKLGWGNGTEANDNCYGVIVDEETVLTVADCTEFKGKQLSHIVHPTSVEISSVHVHPRYKKGTSYYNIAILKLKSFLNYIQPSCIWHGTELPRKQFETLGFGRTDLVAALYEGDELELNPRTSPLISRISARNESTCRISAAHLPRIKHGLAREHVCAGNDFFLVPEMCHLPAGAPLHSSVVLQSDSYDTTFALTQFGRDCGYGEHLIATRLFSHVDWLKSVLLPAGGGFAGGAVQFLDPDRFEGDRCRVEVDGDGRCVPLGQCFSSGKEFAQQKVVKFCSNTRVVCCLMERIEEIKQKLRRTELDECPAVVRSLKPQYLTTLVTFGWRNGTSYNYRCLGSIITRHMVITTRSCLEDGKPDVVIINEKVNMFPVGDVRFHDSYNATDSSFDIALVEVSKPFTWTSHVFPNCLWTNKTHTPLVMRRIYVSDKGNLTMEHVVSKYNSDCQRQHPTQLRRSKLCVKRPSTADKVAMCSNSGDVLLSQAADYVTYLVGLGLRERECERWDYGTYTRMSALVGWIKSHVAG